MKIQLSKPRIWVTGIVVLVAGCIIAAVLLIGNVAFVPNQVDAVTTACPQCHGTVPTYELAYRVHAKHASFDCVRCHGDNSGVVASNSVHTGLKWLGSAVAVFVLLGIIVNSFAINKKTRAG